MVYDRSLMQRFRRVSEQLSIDLKAEPRLSGRGQVVGLEWSGGELVYDGPRFGVAEIPLPHVGRDARGLALVRGLQQAPSHVLEWVVWREAVLGLLIARIRLVPEAADLGLYAGLKYGILNPIQRRELQRIWEQVSPPHTYALYSYQPTLGFPLIDDVMDGAFLAEVIPWLNSLRGGEPQSMSSAIFAAALERWMMKIHCILNLAEVRVLQQLAERPDLSQREIAERLQLSPSAINGVFKSLVRRHLLRLAGQLNFPLLGLYQVVVDLRGPSIESLHAVKAHLLEHPYIRLAFEFGDRHLVGVMLIPIPRMEEFRTWTGRLCQRTHVPQASIHLVTEVVSARRFDSYEAKRGWTKDFWPLLLRAQSIIEGEAETPASSLHSFKYSCDQVRAGTVVPIRLQPQDFAWFEGFERTIAAAGKATSGIDEEARQLGLSPAETKRYRRRTRWLEAQGVRSRPFHFGLLHIGLDVELSIRLKSEPQMVRRIVQACQLFPSLTGVLFDNGGALLVLLLPQAAAVDVQSFLRSVFGESGLDASLGLQPAWRAFGSHVFTLNASSYDFAQGSWVWSDPAL